MIARDLVGFAVRALEGHRLRTGLSLAGVAIGVASVVLLTSLGRGGAASTSPASSRPSAPTCSIVLPGKTETAGVTPFVTGAPHDLTLEDAEAIGRRVRSVRRLAPLSRGLRHRAPRRPAPGRGGGRHDRASSCAVRNLRLQIGRFLPAGRGRAGAARLRRSARRCAASSSGPRIRWARRSAWATSASASSAFSRRAACPSAWTWTRWSTCPSARAMKMFNQSALFRLLLEVRSHDEIAAAQAGVRRVLQERHDGEDDVTMLTQDSVLATFGRILALLTAALAGHRRDLPDGRRHRDHERDARLGVRAHRARSACCKALGVTARQVVAVFLVEAALLSTAGGVVGLAVGLRRDRACCAASIPSLPGAAAAVGGRRRPRRVDLGGPRVRRARRRGARRASTRSWPWRRR